MRGQIMQLGELAGLLGRSSNTVQTWIRNGCPVVAHGTRGRGYQLNTADVVDWVEAQARHAGEGATSPLSSEGLRREKLRNAVELGRLEVDERKGRLIRMSAVQIFLERVLTTLNGRLLPIGAKVAPVVRPDDPGVAQIQIDQAIYEALDECNAEFDGAMAGSLDAGAGEPAASAVPGELEVLEAAAPIDGKPVGGSPPQTKSRGKRGTGPVGNGKGRVSARDARRRK